MLCTLTSISPTCPPPRALGDFAFKHPQALLSPEPAVRSVVLTPSDVLLLMATDGVTDVMGDDDALGFALEAMEKVGGFEGARCDRGVGACRGWEWWVQCGVGD